MAILSLNEFGSYNYVIPKQNWNIYKYEENYYNQPKNISFFKYSSITTTKFSLRHRKPNFYWKKRNELDSFGRRNCPRYLKRKMY